LPSWLDRIKVMLIVTALSAQTIILAFVCMSAVWFISTSLGDPFRVASTLLSGVVGFALSSITFWKIIVRFLEQKDGSE